jgi:hypothetical protein
MGGIVCTDLSHEKDPTNVMSLLSPSEELSPEEVYMIYREETLKLHFLKIDDIIFELEPLNERRYLGAKSLILALMRLKLLPDDNFQRAKDSIFW